MASARSENHTRRQGTSRTRPEGVSDNFHRRQDVHVRPVLRSPLPASLGVEPLLRFLLERVNRHAKLRH